MLEVSSRSGKISGCRKARYEGTLEFSEPVVFGGGADLQPLQHVVHDAQDAIEAACEVQLGGQLREEGALRFLVHLFRGYLVAFEEPLLIRRLRIVPWQIRYSPIGASSNPTVTLV